MKHTIIISLSSGLFSTIIAAFISLYVTTKSNKKAVIKSLQEQLDKILMISIEYPYLEDESFRESWSPNKVVDEKYLRYELYCVLVFNYMERISKFYKYNLSKINNHIDMKSWFRDHSKCWLNPTDKYENVEGYSKEFRNLVSNYLN